MKIQKGPERSDAPRALKRKTGLLGGRTSPKDRRNASPAQSPSMSELALYDGKNFVGSLIQQDRHGWNAITDNGEEIGLFNHQDHAARALLTRHRGGAPCRKNRSPKSRRVSSPPYKSGWNFGMAARASTSEFSAARRVRDVRRKRAVRPALANRRSH